MKVPEVLLIGSGGVGSYFGGRLAAGGVNVSVVCRSDYEVVKEKGIAVESIHGDFHFTPSQVVKKASDYEGRPDFILVTTKVLPEVNLYEIIKDRVYPGTAIVLFQNGIDIEKPVADAFPDNEIISGLLYIGVTRVSPGVVKHEGLGDATIGTFPHGVSDACVRLAEMFTKAGVTCKTLDNIIRVRWKKLTWNAPFNSIPVISQGFTVDKVVADENCLELSKNVIKEIMVLAEKSGYPLGKETIETNIEICRTLIGYKPSMLIDYENNRPMEVDAILGKAVDIAAALGIEVPHLKTLYTLLSMVDRSIRQKNLK